MLVGRGGSQIVTKLISFTFKLVVLQGSKVQQLCIMDSNDQTRILFED